MKNLSYKTLLIIIVFLLIGIVGLLKLNSIKKVSAAWFNDSWMYRKAVSIGNTSATTTNQYVKITLDTAALITASKMKNTCDDIRVTNINGKLLTHFIDGNTSFACNTATTSIYILIDNIPASGSTVYVYYGNPSATNIEPQLGTSQNPAISCKNILEHRSDNKGTQQYYITPTGNIADSIQVTCDMTYSSGGWIQVWHGLPSEAFANDSTHETINLSNNIIFNNMRVEGTNLNFNVVDTVTQTAMLGSSIRTYFNQVHNAPDSPSPKVAFHNLNGTQSINLTNNYFMYGYGNLYRFFYTCIDVSGINSYYIGGGSPSCTPRSSFNSTSVGCYNNPPNNDYCSNVRNVTPIDSGLHLSLYQYQESSVYVRETAITLNISQSMGTIATEEIGGGPIAYWKFDEGIGTTTYDSSGQNNTGTFLSAPIWKNESECVSEKCLSFDNVDDGVSIANKNFVGLTDYTMSAWINLKGNHKNYEGTIMSSGNWNTQWWSFGINQANTAIYMYGYASKAFNFQLNKWTYVTVTRIGGQYNFYVDGKSIGSYSGSSSPLVSDATNTTIGRETYAGGYFDFNGFIDEPKIYPYARTAAQIKLDYNAGKAHASTKKGSSVNLGNSNKSGEFLSDRLVGYWKMDENIGTSTLDSSGNGYTATFGAGDSAPAWSTGKFGVGTSFDGSNDYINFGNPGLSSLTNSTISFWRKAGNASAWLLFQGQTTNHYILATSGTGAFYHNNIGSTTKIYVDGNLATTPLTDNNWHHYIITGANLSTWTNLKLSNYPNFQYNGLIDEVRIYNRALSSSEVSQLYNWNPNVSSLKKPIAYYKFDEGQGTLVNNYGSAGSSFNATFAAGNSAPTWSNDGKYNKSLNFNNTYSYASFYTSVFNGSTSFTASAWIKSNDTSQNQTILSANGPFFLRISGEKFRVGILSGTWFFGDGTISLSNNTWYHLSLVYDGSTVKSYVNGKLDINSNKTGGLNNFNTIYIGYPVPGGENYPFNGLIDEVKIYNSALSADEIKIDYNRDSAIQMGSSNQTIGATTTSLDYCIPGDTTYCTSPIAEWKMDEGSGTSALDTSGNNNTGTFGAGNSAPTWTQGKIGSALSFDGTNDYLTVPNYFNLSSATLEFWFNSKSWSGNSIPISKDGGGSNGYIQSTGTLKFYAPGNTPTVNWGTPSLNIWHHATLVITGTQHLAYLDGLLVGSPVSSTLPLFTGNYNFQIGRFNTGTYPFNGSIDQVRIYNYARTPAQVAYDYNKGAPIGWWKFDECQGNIAYDWSGIGNTGTIIIGASGTQNTLGTCQVGTSAAWTNGATGKLNSSLNFDGTDDYVVINRSTNIEPPNITVSSWVYRTTSSSAAKLILLKTYNNNNSAPWSSYSLSYDTSNNNLLSLFLGFTDNNFIYLDSKSDLPLNTWTLVTGTYDGQNAKIYVNGKLDNSIGETRTLKYDTSSTGNLFIGRGDAANAWLFQGQIDDVRIYNYALTSTQIKTLYNGGAVNFN